MNAQITSGFSEGGKLWFGFNNVSRVRKVWGEFYRLEFDDFPIQEIFGDYKPIGFPPFLQIRSEDESKELAEIQWVASGNQINSFYIEVDCNERGKKIGKVLMSIFILWARSHKFDSISAHSTPKNNCPNNGHPPMTQEQLNKWYEEFGFLVNPKDNLIFLSLN